MLAQHFIRSVDSLAFYKTITLWQLCLTAIPIIQMAFHRPSRSNIPSLPPELPLPRQDPLESKGLSTERRSLAVARLYQTVRTAIPTLPPFSALQSEEQLLTVVKEGLASAASQSQNREALIQGKEAELEKISKRVELKQQLLDSKLREVELYRSRLLAVKKEATGRLYEAEELENRSEFFPLERDLQSQLSAEASHGLRLAHEEIRARERLVQEEIRQLREDQSQYSSQLRLFNEQKQTLAATEAQILKDQETASKQLVMVEEKLAELTDIKERQERKLRVREDLVRSKEGEIARKEGQLRDAQREMQDHRTNFELQLTEMRKQILSLEAELEKKKQGEVAASFEAAAKLKEDLRLRMTETMEHLRIKEKELTQREKVLNALAASLSEEQRCLQLEKAALIEARSQVPQRTVLSEEQIAMLREDIGSQAQRLEDYAEWLVTREAELQAWKGSVLEDKECIENSAVMLDELQVEIEQQRMELEEEKAQLKAEGQEIAAAMRKLKAATREMEERTRVLKSRESLLTHSEAMLQERKVSLQQFEKALDLREKALLEEERRGTAFKPLRPSDYLTPRDVITPRSSTSSAVFT